MPPSHCRRKGDCRAHFVLSAVSLILAIQPFSVLKAQQSGARSNITAIWANEGGDKVSQDELRASRGVENLTGTVLNRAWNGRTITLSGARNESVSFNMILEAANGPATAVSVSFDTLTGPNSATIQTNRQTTGNGVFNWIDRPIELFYVRYLQIVGMSSFGWFRGSDSQMPLRFQAPASGLWNNRPDHNKFYPDILVPLELVSTFNIAAATNQSVWSDIYIPKGTPAGVYSGTVTVKENGVTTHAVPVSLTVQPFSLPDTSSIKGFSHLDANEIQRRYIAEGYINWSDTRSIRLRHIADVYFQLFHRHRIDLIGGDSETPPFAGIHPFFQQRYNGSLFTAANGYDGPGVGVGNTLYAVGPYGTWGPKPTDQQGMWNYADPIATWFQNNMPNVQYFIYLQDEPGTGDFAQVENWAKWLAADPGPGHNLLSMATVSMKNTIEHIPDLQIPTDADDIGECPSSAPWWCDNVEYTYSIASQLSALPNRHMWHYGGGHPGAGTTNTEDEGVAMRTWPWVQFKLGIERWFSWYANLNSPEIDVFQQACTWGCNWRGDPNWGQVSDYAYTNGNGVLVYPGNDINHPANSYGVDGPFASLRLKEWRRGTQDGDYLTFARSIDPVATAAIVQRTMPKALWENKAPGWPTGDPSYFYGRDSWSSNPDDWESSRAQLAQIISSYCLSGNAAVGGNSPCNSDTTLVGTAPSTSATPAPTADPVPAPVASSVSPTESAPLHFMPLTPCRAVDTRLTNGTFGAPSLSADQSRTFPLSASPCNIPANAKAYALNITVIPRQKLRYLTVWPTGQMKPLVSLLNSFDGRIKSNAAIVPAGTNNGVDVVATDSTDLVIDVTGYFVEATNDTAGLAFYPVTPCRITDTRNSSGPFGGPTMQGDTQRSFPVLQSLCGLPTTAKAYSLNYTAVPKHGLGWMSAWPTDHPNPLSSVLNAPTNAITANAGITPAGTNGEITAYVHDDTDLIIDVNGYFDTPGSGGLDFYAVQPCRAYDSRLNGSQAPQEGSMAVDFSIAGCGVPSSAKVMAINATTIPSNTLMYLTLWAAGETQPLVSTLNAIDGQVSSNLAIVPATSGSVSVFMTDKSHLIFDVSGYFK